MHSYQLKHEVVTVNETDYQIRSLKDRQQFADDGQVLDELGISSATWPLFGVLWPSSRVLAGVVSLYELEGKRVLEIGCGLGLSSIVLHNMGVDITASDYHPQARSFMDENLRKNKMQPIKFSDANWDTENPLLGEFDLIIGSDVLYEPVHPERVSRFIECHSSDDVEVIIVDPNRGNRSRFTQAMTGLGYSYDFDRFDVEDTDDRRCKGRVLKFKRRSTDQ